ncbi:MAG: NAD(P)/FAD-dependent oxidoreductase [Endomicrobiales bacterium]|jgi:NADPH-dependent 2,4-dienoyl-CoA reductase/sulfur reductase-like enzyme
MLKKDYTYIIVGAGIAGSSAIEGIREHDKDGSILIIGGEKYLTYARPPLTKELWWGKMKPADLFVNDEKYYERKGVDLLLGVTATSLDAQSKTLSDFTGRKFRYQKLLLATGGTPRKLPIPGGKLEGIFYYRYLDDYTRLREAVSSGTSVTIIGGGFIGSELGASLNKNALNVTMLYPDNYVCANVFPEYLGKVVEKSYINHGVTLIPRDKPVSFEKSGGKFVIKTQRGLQIETDAVVIGIGIGTSTDLAESAGITVNRNIAVNEYQQTSQPDIFAAGDNTDFPSPVLEKVLHLEHWDHAANHGKWAGRNMAGAHLAYDYIPYFYSTIFNFNYEAVGEISPDLQNINKFDESNNKGTVYFLRDNRVCGVLTCNVRGPIDWAKELIRNGEIPPDLGQGVTQ